MGVHFFYTWLTTRYPLVRREYDPETIPQIDNLYLDLNGVLYSCAKDNSALFKDLLSGRQMDEIFIAIMNYINFVVNVVKPKKQIFIAIDGVAPRAKINNQRNRRFATSKKQKEIDEFLVNHLGLDPGLISFKNNSISPGTVFMQELNKHIDFFIKRKIAEDTNWQNINVIFSGGDVPGEGEHKILDYLRGLKQSKEFNPDITHCIYGNDSDLVLLALLTHLPYVMILREALPPMKRIVVNSATKRHTDEQKMEVLFINILSDYFELEFESIITDVPRGLTRIIDDFVLFTYFIGNDFIHQTYCMNTKMGVFDEFIEYLQKFYEKEKSFLVDGCNINWENFCKLLKYFLPLEKKMIKTTINDFDKRIQELGKHKFIADMKKRNTPGEKTNTNKQKKTETHKWINTYKEGVKQSLYSKNESETKQSSTIITETIPDDHIRENAVEKYDREGEIFQETETLKSKEDILKPISTQNFKNIKDIEGDIQIKEEVNNVEENEDDVFIKFTEKLKNKMPDNETDDQKANFIVEEEVENKPKSGDNEDDYSSDSVGNDNKAGASSTNVMKLRKMTLQDESEESEDELNIYDEKQAEQRFLVEFQEQYYKLVEAKAKMQEVYELIENNSGNTLKYYSMYMSDVNNQTYKHICYEYLHGIDFVYKYYYEGCPSWSWYYKYSISPLIRDLYKYMSQIISNGQTINFSYKASEPLKPITQLLYILPKDSLGLLPEPIKNQVLKADSNIRHNYPEDYDIIPFDKYKEYTWVAQIEDIKDEDIQEFLSKINWDELTESEKARNIQGKASLYYYDKTSKPISIKTTVSGIEDMMSTIYIEKFDVNEKYPSVVEKIPDVDLTVTTRQFPTFKVYKHLKIKKQMKHNRYTIYLLLTNETLNELYSSFENSYKKIAELKKGKINTVYLDHLFSKNMRVVNHYDANPKSREFNYLVSEFLRVCKRNYIQVEDINHVYNFPHIRIFDLEEPIFHHIDFDKKSYPFIHCRTTDDLSLKGTFLDITIKKMFPALKMFENKLGKDFFSDSLAISLSTGNKYAMRLDNDNKQKGISPSPIKMNTFVNNVMVSNSDNKLLLIKEDLLRKLDLEIKHLPLLWLVMDSLRITTHAKNHSSLILGDIFDIGLNFFHILNKNNHNWRTVNDMIKIFHIRDKDIHSCSFEYVDKRQTKYYNICLTREGYNVLMSYFIENKEVIAYLKQQDIYVYDKEARRYIYRNKFNAKEMLHEFHKKGDDVNIIVFQIYANILRKEHSSLQLHSSLSLNYDIETITNKLLQFNCADNNQEIFDDQWLMYFMKYSRFKECVWPALSTKPPYHELGDRVIYVNNYDTEIMFGALGIITGIYNNKIEILFDEPFIGATNLSGRCPHFRGAVRSFFDVFNLTRWSQYIVSDGSPRKNKISIWNGEYDIAGLISLIKSHQRKLENKRNIVINM